ncbi:MAG: hypothetical protein ACYTKD_27530 [Planctomycetota bacterium]
MHVDNLWAPKHGNSADEYEDAFAPAAEGPLEGDRLRFAVADGATDAAFSRAWAELVARGYLKGWVCDRSGKAADGLARLSRLWQRRVGKIPLPWYGEEKRRQGAFAAVVGLEISAPDGADGGSGTWRSFAVGDCCLFHLRGERLLGTFPIEDPEDFGSRPVLLSSNTNRNAAALASAATAWGQWAPGDTFCLMSDALACWFLTEHRSGEPSWFWIHDLGAGGSEPDFGEWVSYLRAERGLRNDDVTLVKIVLPVEAREPPGLESGTGRAGGKLPGDGSGG